MKTRTEDRFRRYGQLVKTVSDKNQSGIPDKLSLRLLQVALVLHGSARTGVFPFERLAPRPDALF